MIVGSLLGERHDLAQAFAPERLQTAATGSPA